MNKINKINHVGFQCSRQITSRVFHIQSNPYLLMFLSGNDANNVYPKNAVFLFGAIPFFIKYVEFIEPKGPVEYKH